MKNLDDLGLNNTAPGKIDEENISVETHAVHVGASADPIRDKKKRRMTGAPLEFVQHEASNDAPSPQISIILSRH